MVLHKDELIISNYCSKKLIFQKNVKTTNHHIYYSYVLLEKLIMAVRML